MEFFGTDELVLPPAKAQERLNDYYRHRQEAALARQPARRRPRHVVSVDVPALELPPELADADTIGVSYDDTDGLNFYDEYGRLRDLFADQALAADKRYVDVLRGYLGAETIGPLPFRRLAAAHPQTVNAVSARSCASRTSPGPSTARPCYGAGSPGTTSTSPVPTSPCSAPASANSSASR